MGTGRKPLPRHHAPCTACGADVETFAEELPVPLLCQPCRAAVTLPRPWVECSLGWCREVVRITGAQRRRWELGRPVFCSKDHRWEATHPEVACAVCGLPAGRRGANERGGGRKSVCSLECRGKVQPRRVPDKVCAECGVTFRNRQRVETCSVACGIRLRDRRLRGAPAVRRPWRCPVCGTRCTSTSARRWGRPCSRVCSNKWRNRPDWVPGHRYDGPRAPERATQDGAGPYPAGP